MSKENIDNLWDQLTEALPSAAPLLRQLLDPPPTKKAAVTPRAAREFPFGAFVTVQRFIGAEPVEISGYLETINDSFVRITQSPDGGGWDISYDRSTVKVFAGGPR